MTLVIHIDPNRDNTQNYKIITEKLRSGGTVVIPTETVYGLGAHALDPQAVKKIFSAKGRPVDNPLIVHISDTKMLAPLVDSVSSDAQKLIDAFWPGPLTIIFKRHKNVPAEVTCGLDTIAIRMPAHPIANQIIKISGVPIAAPSANLSGRPSPTSAQHVITDLDGKVDIIVDGGDSEVGLESTVIDLSDEIPLLLRPGGVSKEKIEKVLGFEIGSELPTVDNPRSPGMKYRHYAPDTMLVLLTGQDENTIRKKLLAEYIQLANEGKRVAVIASLEMSNEIRDEVVAEIMDGEDIHIVGTRRNLKTLGSCLFGLLRDLDIQGYDAILIGACPEKGIGVAIMNRLRKASTRII